jgi:hypothetical protein
VDLAPAAAAAGARSAVLTDLVDGGGSAVDGAANFRVGGDVAEADEHALVI